MHSRTAGVLAGVTTTVLLLAASPATASLGPKWIEGPDLTAPPGATGSRWLDVTGTSPADIWAVGTWNRSVTNPLIGHYDGTAWTAVAGPVPPKATGYSLAAVDAVAPGDVWAAGSVVGTSTASLILHYDGVWSVAATGPAVPTAKSALADIDMLSATDGWAVGSTVATGKPAQALIQRYQDGKWAAVPAPLGDFTSTTLSAVHVRSAGDAWAVGTATGLNGKRAALVLHWDGAGWQVVPVPDGGAAGEAESLASVSAPAADDVWAAGKICAGTFCRPLALHLTGGTWSVVPTGGGASELTEVVPLGPDDVWVIGYTTLGSTGETDHAEHWDGHVFTPEGPPPPNPGDPATTDAEPASALEGATAVPGGGVWAVGWSRDAVFGTSHVVHHD